MNHIFVLLGECHPQFPSRNSRVNFVWLSHNALLLTVNLLVSFYFINSPYFVWTATPFCLFFLMELSHFCLCECYTNIMCVSIISVWMSHMRVSIFFVWVSHRYPCIFITSKWTLHFVSFWIISDPFSLLSCVDYHTSFFKWKLHLLYLFPKFWYNGFAYDNFSYFKWNNTFTIDFSKTSLCQYPVFCPVYSLANVRVVFCNLIISN